MEQPDIQMMEVNDIKTEAQEPKRSPPPAASSLENQGEEKEPLIEGARTSPPQDLDATFGSASIVKVEGRSQEVPIAPPAVPNPTPSSSAAEKPSAQAIKIAQMKDAAAKQKRDMEEEEREKMQVLVSNFTEDQLDRYEMFRRAAFPKASIKRLMQTITGNSVSQNAVIAMAGIAKVFIGEIVEEGLDVMERNAETGPVQPKHIREAVRKIRMRGGIPNSKTKRYSPYPL